MTTNSIRGAPFLPTTCGTVDQRPRRWWADDGLKRPSVVAFAFALALNALPAARAQTELAQKRNCLACHALEKKVVGPAYRQVAAKYSGQHDAVDILAAKISRGGAGVWGPVPMPANPQVSEAEARQLARWVLTLK